MNHIHLTWLNVDNHAESGHCTLDLPLTIGRSPDNALVLLDKSAGISRRHVQISQQYDDIVLRDLGSTNGTWVNGSQIEQTVISTGMRITLGHYLLTVTLPVCCQNESCRQWVDANQQLCPWCGHFLADALTTFEII